MSLGQTIQGRDIDCIQIGTGTLIAWIIHRQHPGETMAEHYAEGLLYRLLQLDGNNNDKDNNDKDNNIIINNKAKRCQEYWNVENYCFQKLVSLILLRHKHIENDITQQILFHI